MARSEGMLQVVDRRVPPERLYAQTGIQRLPINTLYQLVSMRQNGDPQLDVAETLLLIPDLFHYWLTGSTMAEYTNATTTCTVPHVTYAKEHDHAKLALR